MINMNTPVEDPKNPATKPHGTTDEVGSPSADQLQGAPGPKRTEFDKTMSDQDIDTAGTDADKA